MATINLGRVGFVQKGTYSGVTTYKVNDVVVYNNGVYACISPTTGNLPTNTTYWKLWLDPSTLVAKTGNETIAGVKTFTANPISSNATEANIALEKTGTGASVFYPYNGTNQLGLADTVFGNIAYMNKAIPSDFIINKNLYVFGSLLLNTGGGLGYGTGSGGTVTQLTSKSTAVTLNKPSGKITMHNASLASGASVSFAFINSLLENTDSIFLFSTTDAISANSYKYEVKYVGNGYCIISITNTSGASLSDNPIFSFTIIKGATA